MSETSLGRSIQLETIVRQVKAGAERWARLGPKEIAELLGACRDRVLDVAQLWVQDAVEAKGIPRDSPLAGEEWVSGPYALLSAFNAQIATLETIAEERNPIQWMPTTTREDGQVVVEVFPATPWERLLLSGYQAEIWQQPEVTLGNIREHIASRFRRKTAPKLSVILGAGNINSIPALDAVHKLVAEGEACVVKLNPVNHYLKEPFDYIFQPIIERKALVFLNGGAETGKYLTNHELVDTLHITGSIHTHDVIVFGPGEEGKARKAENKPLNPRPMSSELGGVGPTIVVPGRWSDQDFLFQAEQLVTQKFHNAGCNCIASQLLVVPKGWDGTKRLLNAVKNVLKDVIDRRPVYYPGHSERIKAFKEAYPNAETLSPGNPFLWVDGLDPQKDEFCFREEAFGRVWGVVALEGSTPDAFLQEAVPFVNEKVFGTLGCQIVIHPSTQKRYASALDKAVAGLAYGTIGVNVWSGVGFLLPYAAWGAYPGHPLNDAQSGIGVVHNTFLFDKPQKTVLHGPFQPFPRTLARGIFHMSPKPLWFVTHKKGAEAARLLTEFEAAHNPLLIPPLFAAALSG